jgi:hypothetical protein
VQAAEDGRLEGGGGLFVVVSAGEVGFRLAGMQGCWLVG